jgi:hypothetical protein
MTSRKIDILIEAIEAEEICKFEMGFWFQKRDCGTVGCIGGMMRALDIENHELGIPEERVGELFFGYDHDKVLQARADDDPEFAAGWTGCSLDYITKQMALRALRGIRDEGVFRGWAHYVG